MLVALALILVAASFVPLWRTDRWWVRLWDYPRLQVAGLLLAVAVAILWLHPRRTVRWLALGAAIFAALGWQASHFIAYFPPYPKEVASAKSCPAERQILLLNANVLLGNRQYGKLLRLVEQRRPDVLLLLEPGPDWERAMSLGFETLSLPIIRSDSKYIWHDLDVASANGRAYRASAPARCSLGPCAVAAGRWRKGHVPCPPSRTAISRRRQRRT